MAGATGWRCECRCDEKERRDKKARKMETARDRWTERDSGWRWDECEDR